MRAGFKPALTGSRRIGFIVTNSKLSAGKVVKVDNGRGDVETRIKEGKNMLLWDKTSCHRFADNRALLLMGVLACNLLCRLRQFYLRSGEVKRSIEWLIKRLFRVAASRRTVGGGLFMWLQPSPWPRHYQAEFG